MDDLFFFNDTATTEIYTLSLHDALPISHAREDRLGELAADDRGRLQQRLLPLTEAIDARGQQRSEEHTSELQSRQYLVCRLLLEKKKTTERLGTSSASLDPIPHQLRHEQ